MSESTKSASVLSSLELCNILSFLMISPPSHKYNCKDSEKFIGSRNPNRIVVAKVRNGEPWEECVRASLHL